MLINLRKKLTNQKGFTLVELLVVIAIIGILAAVAIPKMAGATTAAKDGRLTADLATVDSALSIAFANSLAYPDDLSALTTAPKLLAAVPVDAQGKALTYTPVAATATVPAHYTLTGLNSAGATITSPGSN